ncbi:hypothetical protein BJY21_003297 [Kineosphaera limosa]|uniref:Uncharacterized protein n=1 Tax=Kineosphaera limosa NBRC 100340 TaxID=1184609 RepID=K6WNC6_9MICO|nr:hypothetical protein [Kineosphaera limosa]NYE02113.1 hypothetical protein [Kineosphaera limosa]GAB95286.1 hypothetical protein KILIM_018_00330 [Kineosphaera limosa NBRC 100340]
MTEPREQEARVRAAVLGLIDTIDVPPDSGEPPRRERRGRRRAMLAGVAAAVALLLLVVAIGSSRPVRDMPASSNGPTLPAELPGYRQWRLPQSWSPLPGVAMTWRFHTDHGWGPLDPPRQALLGSDLSTMRYLTGAGTPDASVVSPDGLHLASRTDEGVRLDDLTTGEHVEIPFPELIPRGDTSLTVMAWSPDSQLAYVTLRVGRAESVYEVSPAGRRQVPSLSRTWAIAPSPDGVALAVAPGLNSQEPEDVVVIDRRTGQPLFVRAGWRGLTEGLPGTPIWSLDGSELLVVRDDYPAGDPIQGKLKVTTVDVRTGARQVVESPGYDCSPLAMLSNRRMLCLSTAATTPGVPYDEAPMGLSIFDLSTGERTVVALLPDTSAGVIFLNVAADLARTWHFAMSKPWHAPAP